MSGRNRNRNQAAKLANNKVSFSLSRIKHAEFCTENPVAEAATVRRSCDSILKSIENPST